MTGMLDTHTAPDRAQAVRQALLEAAMVALIEGRIEDARELKERAYGPAPRGATPVYHLPWPILPDAPNVPADIQALAEATEAALAQGLTFGQAHFPGSGLAPGSGRIALAPMLQSVQGGIVWDGGSFSFVVAARGVYLVTARIVVSGLAPGSAVGCNAGSLTQTYTAGAHIPVAASGLAGATLSREVPLDAGTHVALWYSIPSAATLSEGQFSVSYQHGLA